jgi:hypothetical protein
MSKLEEAAYKAHPYNGDYRGLGDSNSKFREEYINGYQQAEKDLALTVGDIKTIDILLNKCVDCSNPYQEVLNRFNNQKRK